MVFKFYLICNFIDFYTTHQEIYKIYKIYMVSESINTKFEFKSNEKSILYVLFFLCIFFLGLMIYNEFYKHDVLYEGMEQQSKTIVLMGDSIFKNNTYVKRGKSVEDILKTLYNGKIINLAKDDEVIKDIYTQINKLPIELNNTNTTIFVSIGGNDILNKYVYSETTDVNNFEKLNVIYLNYKDALSKLREKFPNPKIMLSNLYYPQSVKYLRYRELIKKWNDLLFEYQDDPINKINDILDVSLLMTDINDFSLCIEPSETGGMKIAKQIIELSKE